MEVSRAVSLRQYIKVSRSVIESRLLESIQQELFTDEGFIVFRQEVARLLAERRKAPDQERVKEKFVEVERELANMMSAIKQGIVTVSTKAEVEKIERERSRLLGMMQAHSNGDDAGQATSKRG